MPVATAHRDLRTGRSLWMARRLPPLKRSRLAATEETEVLVVGAGISGALIAEMLASDGHKVLVLDRRGPALGATAASTALVQYDIDQPLTALSRQIGAGDAARAWRRSFQAMHGLAARTRALGIDCDLDPRESLYLAGDSLDADGLAAEAEARRAIGLETGLLSRVELRRRHGIDRPAALVCHGNFGVDPRRLAAGYLRAALAAGARLAAPVEVAGIEARHGSVLAHTTRGEIRCRTLVFATGYEFPKLVPLHGHRLISTYAMATAPQPRRLWPGRAMIWEASDPYLYGRTTPDGRVVLGGEDEDFADEAARDALLPERIATIAKKAARLLPGIDTTPAFAWAGTFGASETGLPSIGPIPGHPGVWAVLGYGGNGTTYSRLAAEIIRTALAGGSDPEADLYAFRPAPPRR